MNPQKKLFYAASIFRIWRILKYGKEISNIQFFILVKEMSLYVIFVHSYFYFKLLRCSYLIFYLHIYVIILTLIFFIILYFYFL